MMFSPQKNLNNIGIFFVNRDCEILVEYVMRSNHFCKHMQTDKNVYQMKSEFNYNLHT